MDISDEMITVLAQFSIDMRNAAPDPDNPQLNLALTTTWSLVLGPWYSGNENWRKALLKKRGLENASNVI